MRKFKMETQNDQNMYVNNIIPIINPQKGLEREPNSTWYNEESRKLKFEPASMKNNLNIKCYIKIRANNEVEIREFRKT